MTIPVPVPPNPIDAAKAIARTVLWGLLVLIFLIALGYAAYLHWRAGQAADAIAKGGVESVEALPAAIRAEAKPGDLVVCLGAGDITQWAYALPEQLEALA